MYFQSLSTTLWIFFLSLRGAQPCSRAGTAGAGATSGRGPGGETQAEGGGESEVPEGDGGPGPGDGQEEERAGQVEGRQLGETQGKSLN